MHHIVDLIMVVIEAYSFKIGGRKIMEILAKTYRGNTPDLFTYGTIAVVDSDGKLQYSAGDPNEIAFARSSAKLIQAMVPLYYGIDEKYGFTKQEIAQICASHSGEDTHVETVRSILKKIGLDESYLKCGAHLPLKKDVADRMVANSEEALDIHNNCSGKHAGMLATTKGAGDSLEDYYKTDHPTQIKVLNMISKVCDYPADKIEIGVDGCGVPVHALPIYNLAYGMARLSDPGKIGEEYVKIGNKITESMTEHPLNASGSDRLDYQVISKYPGKIIIKSGANGYFAGYLPDKNLGFAVKTYDGIAENRNLIVIEMLKQLDVIKPEDEEYFDSLYKIDIFNHRKEVVGYTEASFELKRP